MAGQRVPGSGRTPAALKKYLTAEVLDAAGKVCGEAVAVEVLQAVLPLILPAHKASVLRDMARDCFCLGDHDLFVAEAAKAAEQLLSAHAEA